LHAQVILNGHEYAAAQPQKRGISFTKESNCFAHISDAADLSAVAGIVVGGSSFHIHAPCPPDRMT
jgi:hypothetical protein